MIKLIMFAKLSANFMGSGAPTRLFIHASVGALLFSIFAMAPVLPNFSERKFGNNISGVGSDSYGFMYSMWLKGQDSDGKVRAGERDLLSGFPNGRHVLTHVQATSAAAYQLAAHKFSPAFCYNLFVMLWFLAAYFLGFWLVQLLGVSIAVSHLAAFTIGLNPYQVLQSVDHLDLAMTWPVLLDILLVGRLLILRQQNAVPLMIFVTAASVFSHPYYLICLAIINALPLLWWMNEMLRKRLQTQLRHWLQLALSAAGGLAVVWIWKAQFVSLGGGDIGDVSRDLEQLYTYSSNFWNFILPPHYSLPFAEFTTRFKTEQTMALGSNLVENTLYPGLLVLLSLPLLAWQALKTRGAKPLIKVHSGVLLFLFALVVIPFLCSIAPSIDVAGVKLYTPTYLIHEVLPQFRTLSRLGYVTSIGLILAFALLADGLAKRYLAAGTLRKVGILAAGIFMAADLSYLHNSFYSDTSKVPAAYTFLRDSTPESAVIFEVPFMWGYLSAYWQSYHHRRNFGIFDITDPQFSNMAATSRMDLRSLVQFCRTNKVDYLLIHTQQDLQIPGQVFENRPDPTWIFFLFGTRSYVIKVADFPS